MKEAPHDSTLPSCRPRTVAVRGVQRAAGATAISASPMRRPPFGDRRFRPPEPAEPWDGRARRDAIRADGAPVRLRGRPGRRTCHRRDAGRRHPDRQRVDARGPTGRRAAARARLRARRRADARFGRAARLRRRHVRACRHRLRHRAVPARPGGFAVLEDVPQNLGVLDQQAALRWVRREIARVRGRPRPRHGDGALRGRQHARRPARAARMRRAVRSGDPAERTAQRAAAREGGPHDAGDREAARSVRDAARIRRRRARRALPREQTAVAAGGSPLGGGPAVALAIGGDAVPQDPLDGAHRWRRPRIPVLIGSTSEEYRLWFVPSGALDRCAGRR